MNTIPLSLRKVNLLFSKNCNIEIENYQLEKESSDYNAALFDLNKKKVIFRLAKITPKKIGFFVTLWKRNISGVTIPFQSDDKIDLIIVEVRKLDRIGHFIFPKSILIEKGIISSRREGKRGFRIYPPWESALNKQATLSQLWQSQHFFEHKRITVDDALRLRKLIHLK
ncbi:MepB family protein [Leptospira sarikeiensis]|uniref:MepB family protein n=1 Tax=Leptospira sarikeiensis TaxID=2484943 RepID=UPI001FECFD17|nr:MepB family protein [Leptospira sarikeiensis]